jgi:PIN domain nuclease of toxin-antitoxin system
MPIAKQLLQHKLVLDTHVWIWLMNGDVKLSARFRKDIEKSKEKENIFLSAISLWEFGMLAEKKRIEVEMDPLDWIEQALFLSSIHIAPISPSIACQSCRLLENLHADPADRLIVATAREYNAVLVSCDTKLLEYGKGHFVTVHDPCSS